jgi:hypothetical protein
MGTIIEIFKTIGVAILMCLAIVAVIAMSVGALICVIFLAICTYRLALTLSAPDALAQAIGMMVAALVIIILSIYVRDMIRDAS